MAANDMKSVIRRMLLVSSCVVVLLTLTFISDAHAQRLSGRTTVYGTVVERESGQDARLPNAVVSFLSSNGTTMEARADENGEYSIDLPSGAKYSLTVTSRGFCPVHRPAFAAQSERKAKFDIVLTTACSKDLVVVPGEDSTFPSVETEFCAKAGVYYCEQQVTIDARSPVTIMIGFASRRIEGARIVYGSNMKRSKVARRSETLSSLSVSVAFGTYTIRAKNVTVDFQKKTLNARGNVSITHDDQEISVGSPCINIRFDDREPTVRSCE